MRQVPGTSANFSERRRAFPTISKRADTVGKYIHATEFTNGVGGHLIKIQKNTLKAEAESLRSDAAKFEDNYLNSPGGSDQAKLNEELRFNNTMKASTLDGEVSRPRYCECGKVRRQLPGQYFLKSGCEHEPE